MTDNRETIEMLKILKEQALKSHNDTAVLEVKIDSFNFVLDEAIKALEEKPCEDWYDVPSDEMTLEQARQAVKDLRKKLAELLAQDPCEKNEEAIKMLIRLKDRINFEVTDSQGKMDALNMAIEVLKQNPCENSISREEAPATPKKKTGWHIAHGMLEDRFWCSCGFIQVMDSNVIEWKYCPLCGGERMQEVEK